LPSEVSLLSANKQAGSLFYIAAMFFGDRQIVIVLVLVIVLDSEFAPSPYHSILVPITTPAPIH